MTYNEEELHMYRLTGQTKTGIITTATLLRQADESQRMLSSRSFPSSSSSSSSGGGNGMRELLGDTLPETIRVEHTFTLDLGDKLWHRLDRLMGTKAMRYSVRSVLDLAKEYAESFRFIAIGIGSYFFLLGVSKVLEAGGGGDGTGKKSSSSSSSSRKPSAADDRSTKSSRRRRPPSNDSTMVEGISPRPTTIMLQEPLTLTSTTTELPPPPTASASAATPTLELNTETATELLAAFPTKEQHERTTT